MNTNDCDTRENVISTLGELQSAVGKKEQMKKASWGPWQLSWASAVGEGVFQARGAQRQFSSQYLPQWDASLKGNSRLDLNNSNSLKLFTEEITLLRK